MSEGYAGRISRQLIQKRRIISAAAVRSRFMPNIIPAIFTLLDDVIFSI